MSISLYWQPVEKGGYLDTATPSDVKEILEEAFGSMPFVLSDENTHLLSVIRKASPRDAKICDFLIEQISTHGSIRVSAE